VGWARQRPDAEAGPRHFCSCNRGPPRIPANTSAHTATIHGVAFLQNSSTERSPLAGPASERCRNAKRKQQAGAMAKSAGKGQPVIPAQEGQREQNHAECWEAWKQASGKRAEQG
jgi:hypothetical protein